MKKNLLFSLVCLTAGSLLAADSSLKDDVKSAATQLGSQTNYSWTTTVDAGNNSRFRPGPTEGKTEKSGYTTLSLTFGDNTVEAVTKGASGAIKTSDSGWQSLSDAEADSGGGFNPTLFVARLVQNYQTPDVQAASFADDATDLKKDGNAVSGNLTESSARALLAFRGGGNGGPTVSNAKGSVTFWITNGELTKYQYHVTGTVSFDGNDREVDRTATTEIKDVNATKIDVSDDAKKKLQ